MNRKIQKLENVVPKKYHKKLVKLNYDFNNTRMFVINQNANRRISEIIRQDQSIWKIENGLNLLFDVGLIYIQHLDELYYFEYFCKNQKEEKLIFIDISSNLGWIENNFIEKGRTEIWYGKINDYKDFSKNKLSLINHPYCYKEFEADLSCFVSFRRMMLLLFSKYDFLDKTDRTPILKTKHKRKKFEISQEDNVYNIDKCFFTTIEIDACTVNAYFRKQRYGVGRSKTKIIYIDKFTKSGYKRRAKKLSVGAK